MKEIIETIEKFANDNKVRLNELKYKDVVFSDLGNFGFIVEFNPMTELDPWVLVDFDPVEKSFYVYENMDGDIPNSTNQRFYGTSKELTKALNLVLLGNSSTNREFVQW